MIDATTFAVATGGVLAVAFWLARPHLANPSPRFRRWCRRVNRAASLLCGVCSLFLIWTAFAVPGVSWLFGLLGAAILAFNLLLFLPAPKGRP